MSKKSRVVELIKKWEQQQKDEHEREFAMVETLPKDNLFKLFEQTKLPNDISNLCDSYLSCDQRIYIREMWHKFENKNRKHIYIAASNGWIDLLEWIYKQNQLKNDIDDVYERAAKNGHIEVIKWIRNNISNTFWYNKTCSCAAEGGHLEIIKWAASNGCSVDSDTSLAAARNGHLNILIWLKENRYELNQQIYDNACYRQQFEVLQWLSINFPRYVYVQQLPRYCERSPEYEYVRLL